MRVRACAVVFGLACASLIVAAGCGRGLFGKMYEYEEDLYVALDGTADVIVNASIPALVVLRGLDLDINPSSPVDRDKIRRLYESPLTDVTRVSRPWRRNGRRYVQIRVRVSDIRRLHETPPFAWSTYQLDRAGTEFVFRQTVGPSAHRPGTLKNVGWTGGEVVAFRLHLPSRILDHNARDIEKDVPTDIARGNILAWEQRLTDRLDGRPVAIQVRMDAQSILYRTLWLFGGAFTAAVLLLLAIVWATVRRGKSDLRDGVQELSLEQESKRSGVNFQQEIRSLGRLVVGWDRNPERS